MKSNSTQSPSTKNEAIIRKAEAQLDTAKGEVSSLRSQLESLKSRMNEELGTEIQNTSKSLDRANYNVTTATSVKNQNTSSVIIHPQFQHY